jgi:hypothetical protein
MMIISDRTSKTREPRTRTDDLSRGVSHLCQWRVFRHPIGLVLIVQIWIASRTKQLLGRVHKKSTCKMSDQCYFRQQHSDVLDGIVQRELILKPTRSAVTGAIHIHPVLLGEGS